MKRIFTVLFCTLLLSPVLLHAGRDRDCRDCGDRGNSARAEAEAEVEVEVKTNLDVTSSAVASPTVNINEGKIPADVPNIPNVYPPSPQIPAMGLSEEERQYRAEFLMDKLEEYYHEDCQPRDTGNVDPIFEEGSTGKTDVLLTVTDDKYIKDSVSSVPEVHLVRPGDKEYADSYECIGLIDTDATAGEKSVARRILWHDAGRITKKYIRTKHPIVHLITLTGPTPDVRGVTGKNSGFGISPGGTSVAGETVRVLAGTFSSGKGYAFPDKLRKARYIVAVPVEPGKGKILRLGELLAIQEILFPETKPPVRVVETK